jgi:TatD DNase family protein
MALTDTHTHLHFTDYEADLDDVMARAEAAGVRYFIAVGTHLDCSRKALRLAESRARVFAAAGCHPHDAKDFRQEDLAEYRRLLAHAKMRAIGEVGLDFYRNLSPREDQERVFRAFLALHRETGLALILHVREAHADVFRILREEIGSQVKGLLHCFSGDEKVLAEGLSLGLAVSFACNVTYPKNDYLRRVIPKVPQDKILLETDCPFLAPQSRRGVRNEPAYLLEAAALVAKLSGISVGALSRRVTENAAALFGFALEPEEADL